MRKEFNDYFYDNILTVRTTENKPYITIVAENDEEVAQVILDRGSLKELIDHLQVSYKNMQSE